MTSGDAIGYIRVSTIHQQTGVSEDVQERSINDFCKRRGLNLIGVVRETVSGTKVFRKKLDSEVMPLVLQQRIGSVVCYDLDRWFRSEYGRLKWEHEVLQPHGVELLVVNEADFTNRYDRDFMRGLVGNFNQFFAAQTRQKIVDAMQHIALNRQYCGGVVPYGLRAVTVGYRESPQGKKLPIKRFEPDLQEGNVVAFVKEVYARGSSHVFPIPDAWQGKGVYGANTITMILNSLGFRQRNGKPFNTAFVKRLLHDKDDWHIGTYTYNKSAKDQRGAGKPSGAGNGVVRIPEAFPAVVSLELQRACQEKISRQASRNRTDTFSISRSDYLGSGLFHCANCKTVMTGRTQPADAKHKQKRHRYLCTSHYNKSGCDAPSIDADPLHASLKLLVGHFVAKNAETILRRALEIMTERTKQLPDSIASLSDRIVQIARKKANLIANLEEAPNLGAVLEPRLLSLAEEESTLREVLSKVESTRPEVELDFEKRVRAALASFDHVWEQSSIPQRNQVLKALISSAQVDTRTKKIFCELAVHPEHV